MAYPPFRALGSYRCIFGNDPFGVANPDYDPVAGFAPMGIPLAAWSDGTFVSATELTCASPPFFSENGPVDVVIVDQNPSGLPIVDGRLMNVVFYQAAAWTWLQPQILSIDPDHGSGAGFEDFTVTGVNFYPGRIGPSGAESNPNWIEFGFQRVAATYVNPTTLTGKTPGYYQCTPEVVDVTLIPPLLPVPSNAQFTVRQASSTLPGAYTYDAVWFQYTGAAAEFSFTTCDLRISSDWQDFLDWFVREFGYAWGGRIPPPWRFKFIGRIPPFTWWWNGRYPPGPVWSFPGTVPDPNGWWSSVSGFRGDIFTIAGSRPVDPRSWADFAGFAFGSAGMLGGSPGIAATFRNRLVYAASGYAVGTEAPPLRIFDGSYDREVVRIPPTPTGEARAIVSVLTANGTVYVSTWDDGADASTYTGRVFVFELESASLTPIGASFPAGHIPYALAWHNGMLWCGTHRQDAVAIGAVYRIRPDLDTAWTLDYDLAAQPGITGVASLLSFKGTLYVGTTAAAGTFGVVLARAIDGTYTIGEAGVDGVAQANNGYLALKEYKGALYAAYWNHDTPPIATIRVTSDGVTWTTSLNGSDDFLRPFIAFAVDDGTLFAVGGGLGLAAAILSSDDGVTWTDLTAQLPETDKTALPAIGVVVL